MTELREAIRSLLLPIDPACEDEAIDAASAELLAAGVTADDQPECLRAGAEGWVTSGRTSPVARAAKAFLEAGDAEYGPALSRKYVELHGKLQEQHDLTARQATRFLSHARTAAVLADEEAMSAAQIAKLLAARDARTPFHWGAVSRLLGALGLAPELDEAAVAALIEQDRALEADDFADAGLEEASEIVGAVADRLGFPGDLAETLGGLVSPDLSTHGAYLRMLFYQCVVAEFYDHALTVLYEFEPRGGLPASIFSGVLGGMEGGTSPFLDNAKSVDRMDVGWARAKKRRERVRALPLVDAIQGLEEMGFASRRELAGWVRRWILRVMRLREPLVVSLPDAPTPEQAVALARAIAMGESRTTGIIEQRLVDAAGLLAHPEGEGWRAHGIGDSVNASNVSRAKIGDCEFLHAEGRRLVAYEAHAGRLSEVYVGGHLATLARVVPGRVEEWERLADLGEWSVEVVFVAHTIEAKPLVAEVAGMPIAISFVTFEEFLAGHIASPGVESRTAQHLNAPLNERRTPQYVRDRYLELAAA
jgi:hypothetical protein